MGLSVSVNHLKALNLAKSPPHPTVLGVFNEETPKWAQKYPKVFLLKFLQVFGPLQPRLPIAILGTPSPWSLLKATRSIPMPCRPEAGDQRGVNIGKRRLTDEDSSLDSENNLLWVIELQGNCLDALPMETYPPVFSGIHKPIVGALWFSNFASLWHVLPGFSLSSSFPPKKNQRPVKLPSLKLT